MGQLLALAGEFWVVLTVVLVGGVILLEEVFKEPPQ